MTVLITGMWHAAKEHLDEIRELGYEVYYMENEADELPCDPAIIDGMICCQPFEWHDINEFTCLKWIQTESVGYDRIGWEETAKRGIRIYNVGDCYSIPMAEYVVGHLLAHYQEMKHENANRIEHGWNKGWNKQELTGKNVCIIGSGNIAKQVAKRLSGFDCDITAVTHTVRKDEFLKKMVGYNRMDEALSCADIVILATSPSKMNANGVLEPTVKLPLITAREFALMQQSSVFVNISRGNMIDQSALLDVLNTGKLECAILDVFETEPLDPDDPLWNCERAILTPHDSYWGDGAHGRMWSLYRDRLIKELNSEE